MVERLQEHTEMQSVPREPPSMSRVSPLGSDGERSHCGGYVHQGVGPREDVEGAQEVRGLVCELSPEGALSTIILKRRRAVVARLVHTQKVSGSNPLAATNRCRRVAQLAERGPDKAEVVGSNPTTPTMCADSSVGRAIALQAEGRRFETCSAHQARVVQSGRTSAFQAECPRFESEYALHHER